VNLHDWIDELCDVLDVELDVDESLVLDVAREASENVGATAGAVSAFLLGYAVAQRAAQRATQGSGDADEIEELADAAIDLARKWDKTPDQVAHEDDDPEVEAELTDA